MGSSGRILVFLVISLIFVLGYAAFNFAVTKHVEDVVAQAPSLPEANFASADSPQCQRAQERYNQVFDRGPGNNFERHEIDLENARAEVNRNCPAD